MTASLTCRFVFDLLLVIRLWIKWSCHWFRREPCGFFFLLFQVRKLRLLLKLVNLWSFQQIAPPKMKLNQPRHFHIQPKHHSLTACERVESSDMKRRVPPLLRPLRPTVTFKQGCLWKLCFFFILFFWKPSSWTSTTLRSHLSFCLHTTIAGICSLTHTDTHTHRHVHTL